MDPAVSLLAIAPLGAITAREVTVRTKVHVPKAGELETTLPYSRLSAGTEDSLEALEFTAGPHWLARALLRCCSPDGRGLIDVQDLNVIAVVLEGS